MPRKEYLGEFEEIVLLTIARLSSDAYGMQIRREIQACTDRTVSIGAVYATVERLQRKRFIRMIERATDPMRDGRPRRFYEITSLGTGALGAAERARASLRGGMRTRRSHGG